MGMLRTSGNKMAGRAKTIDETLTYKGLIDLLEKTAIGDDNSSSIKGRAVYTFHIHHAMNPVESARLTDAPLRDILALVEQNAVSNVSCYKITHEVWSGKNDEKHYVDYEDEGTKSKVYDNRISIDFVVEKSTARNHRSGGLRKICPTSYCAVRVESSLQTSLMVGAPHTFSPVHASVVDL